MQRSPAALAALSCCLAAGSLVAQRDNVLIIVADDLGVDHVPAYGESAQAPPMPTIDGLAARGVLFRNAWVNTVCSATRAALHTGRYGFRTGVGTWIPDINGGHLQPSEITLPEMLDLGETGHAHALIGKWHLGDVGGELAPNVAGWSHFAGFLEGSTLYYKWERTVNGVTQPWTTYNTTQIVDDALAWISTQTEPWMCFVSFCAPHRPFHYPPAHLHTRPLPPPGGPTAPARIELYRAAVEAMDTEIGRLFTALGQATMDRTHVIFLGDNGTPSIVPSPPFPRGRGKTLPFEGGVRVPLIIAGPAVTSPGREVRSVVCAPDVFSTVADLCDVDLDETIPPWVTIDGVSIEPYLGNPAQPPLREFAYTERFNGATWEHVNDNGFCAVRDQRYKLIRRFRSQSVGNDGPFKEVMFDLWNDPWENSNILDNLRPGEQTEAYNALRAEIARVRSPQPSVHFFAADTCKGSGGSPTLNVLDLPRVGQPYRVSLSDGPESSIAWLLIGGSNSRWGTMPLPYPLGRGGTSCAIQTAGTKILVRETGPSGHIEVPLQVPNSLSVVGEVIFHSWLILDPAAGYDSGMTSSNASTLVVGL